MNDVDSYLTRTIVGESRTVPMGRRIIARTILIGQQTVDLRAGRQPAIEFMREFVLRLPAQDPWKTGRPVHVQGALGTWFNRYAIILAASGWMSTLVLLAVLYLRT